MINTVLNELVLLMIFLLVGVLLRELIKPFRAIYLPAGIIGGCVALIMGPQVLGLIAIPETWSGYASPMVNIVMASMLFGITINKSKAGGIGEALTLTFLTYSMQAFLGIALGFALCKVWPGLYEGWGLMSVFSFYGGHGGAITAGGAFESVGIMEMTTMGIVLSTIGLVVAMVVGMILVNYGIRKGYAQYVKHEKGDALKAGPIPKEKQRSLGKETMPSAAISGLALQFGIICLCMWSGKIVVKGLALLIPALSSLPSLVYSVIGALLVYHLMLLFKIDGYADKQSINSLGQLALEFCVCSATATLDLQFIGEYIAPIMIISVVLVAITIFNSMVLTKRWMKKDWFEYAMYKFGGFTGVVASGMALYRCVDPDGKSDTMEKNGGSAFITNPFSSTMIAFLPLICAKSMWGVCIVFAVVNISLLLFGELVLRKNKLRYLSQNPVEK